MPFFLTIPFFSQKPQIDGYMGQVGFRRASSFSSYKNKISLSRRERGLGFAKWNPCSNCFRFADFVQTCHLAAAVTHCGNGDHTLAFHKYFISHCHANVGSNSPGEKSLCRRHEPASKINSG